MRKGLDNIEAIVVSKGEGKSYAELLRTVKDGIKGKEDLTKNITNIRQTKSGDMVITTKKEKDSVEAIKRALGEVAEASTIVSKRGRGREDAVIFIKGMDAISTKAEVREALIEVGARDAELKIGELRPFYGSSQAVTARLPEDAAEKILKRKELRIGYNRYRVSKRVDIIQCYK